MPFKSKLKNYNCPSTNIMRMNRAICMIPEICENLPKILWETLLKALTGDRVLTSERAYLQKRRIVALLHILAYFR